MDDKDPETNSIYKVSLVVRQGYLDEHCVYTTSPFSDEKDKVVEFLLVQAGFTDLFKTLVDKARDILFVEIENDRANQ